MRKAAGTTSEIIIGSLMKSTNIDPGERQKRMMLQLKKIEQASKDWGAVGPCMHPKLLKEAGSLASGPI